MPAPALPSLAHIDLSSGIIDPAAEVVERRLSDMPAWFQDQPAAQALLSENPVLYRVYAMAQPDTAGWRLATSVIESGRIGAEYYMTRGHAHVREDAPEVYLTLRGRGMLVMQSRTDETVVQVMQPGSINYIPGGWAHRTVNTGDEPLVFFAVWSIDAGHDYEAYAERGFAKLILAGEDGPRVVDNPSYVKAKRA